MIARLAIIMGMNTMLDTDNTEPTTESPEMLEIWPVLGYDYPYLAPCRFPPFHHSIPRPSQKKRRKLARRRG